MERRSVATTSSENAPTIWPRQLLLPTCDLLVVANLVQFYYHIGLQHIYKSKTIHFWYREFSEWHGFEPVIFCLSQAICLTILKICQWFSLLHYSVLLQMEEMFQLSLPDDTIHQWIIWRRTSITIKNSFIWQLPCFTLCVARKQNCTVQP